MLRALPIGNTETGDEQSISKAVANTVVMSGSLPAPKSLQ
jgi:hypothetical protein